MPVTLLSFFRISLLRLHVDLKVGDVKGVTALGKEFCVFRGETGEVGVLDAYCPHLGANLSVGGTVKGDCVQCPFHGWEFDAKGVCRRIPYAKEIPLRVGPDNRKMKRDMKRKKKENKEEPEEKARERERMRVGGGGGGGGREKEKKRKKKKRLCKKLAC